MMSGTVRLLVGLILFVVVLTLAMALTAPDCIGGGKGAHAEPVRCES